MYLSVVSRNVNCQHFILATWLAIWSRNGRHVGAAKAAEVLRTYRARDRLSSLVMQTWALIISTCIIISVGHVPENWQLIYIYCNKMKVFVSGKWGRNLVHFSALVIRTYGASCDTECTERNLHIQWIGLWIWNYRCNFMESLSLVAQLTTS